MSETFSIARSVVWARLDPDSARGSIWLRRADMTANSAATKKALPTSRTASQRIPTQSLMRHRPFRQRRCARCCRRAARAPAGRLEADPVDPASVHAGHAERSAADVDRVAHGRDAAELAHDVAADRFVGRLVRHGEARDLFGEFVRAQQAREVPVPRGALQQPGADLVMFVGHFPDDFLHEVLQGGDRRRFRRTRRARRRAAGCPRAVRRAARPGGWFRAPGAPRS